MSRLYDAEHWRRRAEEMRKIANDMGPLDHAKDAVLQIADEYDRLTKKPGRDRNKYATFGIMALKGVGLQ